MTSALIAAGRCSTAGQKPGGRLVARSALSPAQRDAMFALLQSHFRGVTRAVFEEDLAEKQCAILLETDEGVLRGFSTLQVYRATVSERPITVVYSGDTIVERAFWGSPVLARTWIHSVRQVATGEVYWLLLTSGYRTYRFLPVFFRDFYPRHDRPASDADHQLLDTLARERFGAHYDTATGVVRFDHPQILVDDLLTVREGRLHDAHVEFFVSRNPGFVRGDELACLTRVADENLTAAGRRMAAPRRV